LPELKLQSKRYVTLGDQQPAYLNGFIVDVDDYSTQKFKDALITGTALGSYAVVLPLPNGEVLMGCDQLGIYPLYYTTSPVVIADRLQHFKGKAMDEIGVMQRLNPFISATLGERTLLKGVFRLLPGSYVWFDKTGAIKQRGFTKAVTQKSGLKEAARHYHETAGRIAQYLSKNECALLFSGGLDSRIALSYFKSQSAFRLLTYGKSQYPDVHIARRIAEKENLPHTIASNEKAYFQSTEAISEFSERTEAFGLCDVLELQELYNPREAILFGEITESVTARWHKPSKATLWGYLKYYLGANSQNKRPLNEQFYSDEQLLLKPNLFSKLGGTNYETYKAGTLSDLAQLESAQENLFNGASPKEAVLWFTRVRLVNARQVVLLNEWYGKAYSPLSSGVLLQVIMGVSAQKRARYRLLKKLFRCNPELLKLAKYPTAQVPLVRASAPLPVILFTWYLAKLWRNLLKKRHANYFLSRPDWKRLYAEHQKELAAILALIAGAGISNAYVEQKIKNRLAGSTQPLVPTDINLSAALAAELVSLRTYETN
jgi:hypothetical protein